MKREKRKKKIKKVGEFFSWININNILIYTKF